MPLQPRYGETTVPDDELVWLRPQARALVSTPATLLEIYDLEQAVQEEVTQAQLGAVLAGDLDLDVLLSDAHLRKLHRLLYDDIWQWAGTFRRYEVNIGVAPEAIAVEVRQALETIAFRWQHTDDWTPRTLGIAVHAELVRIHPFVDGNGRTTRLLADLAFTAAQRTDSPLLYQWDLDKADYLMHLRRYDRTRDPHDLADFVNVKPLGE